MYENVANEVAFVIFFASYYKQQDFPRPFYSVFGSG